LKTRFILSAINPSQPNTIEGFLFLFGGWLALLPVQIVQHLNQSPGQTIHPKVLAFAHVSGELAFSAALPIQSLQFSPFNSVPSIQSL